MESRVGIERPRRQSHHGLHAGVASDASGRLAVRQESLRQVGRAELVLYDNHPALDIACEDINVTPAMDKP